MEKNVPVKVFSKVYKLGDIIMEDLSLNDIDKSVSVISNDIICEVFNRNNIQNNQTQNVSVRLTKTNTTSGCD